MSDGLCLLCATPLAEREAVEPIDSGARGSVHAFCAMSAAIGHHLGACRCVPELADASDREIALVAYERLRERDYEERYGGSTDSQAEPR